MIDLQDKLEMIEQIREFNRFYTVLIGTLDRNFLDSEHSVSDTRVLFELYSNEENTAYTLIERLHIDKSYMSRILKSFERKGFLERRVSKKDKRFYNLYLTEKGIGKTKELIEIANQQIGALLQPLTPKECNEVIQAMNTITKYFTV